MKCPRVFTFSQTKQSWSQVKLYVRIKLNAMQSLNEIAEYIIGSVWQTAHLSTVNLINYLTELTLSVSE